MPLPKPEIHKDFDLSKLAENPDNPRVLSQEGARKLAASLDEFGMLEAIVANRRADGSLVVVGGHQRLAALLAKGERRSLVTIIRVDAIQEKRLNLMLNGHHGTWDGERLESIMKELAAAEVALGDLGLDGVAPYEAVLSRMVDEQQAAEEAAGGLAPAGATEIDVDGMVMKHRCPACGFEFDKPTNADGRRSDGPGRGHHRVAEAPMSPNDDDQGPEEDTEEADEAEQENEGARAKRRASLTKAKHRSDDA